VQVCQEVTFKRAQKLTRPSPSRRKASGVQDHKVTPTRATFDCRRETFLGFCANNWDVRGAVTSVLFFGPGSGIEHPQIKALRPSYEARASVPPGPAEPPLHCQRFRARD